MSATSRVRTRIAIVGAGMCGLACAIPLCRAGLDVAVFEQAPAFEEIGAGVGLGPNAIKALKLLGVLDAVVAKSNQASLKQRVFRFIEGVEGHKFVYDYGENVPAAESVGLGIYRPAFLEALIPLLPPSIVRFNKQCIKLATNPSSNANGHLYTLEFADGTTYDADLVIGADGVKSTVRGYVVSSSNPNPSPGSRARSSDGISLHPQAQDHIKFSNVSVYRGLVQFSDLRDSGVKIVDQLQARPHAWVGKNKHFVTFPIKGGETLNVVAFVSSTPSVPQPTSSQHSHPLSTPSPALPLPWVTQLSSTDQGVQAHFADWGSDARTMLSFLKGASRWSVHMVWPVLEGYTSYLENQGKGRDGGLVLVGDAAHAMQPHLGAGVGQGFEDVYVLSRLLVFMDEKPDCMDLETLLRTYDTLRVERANSVSKRSMQAGVLYESHDPQQNPEGSDGSLGEQQRKELAAKLKGIWEPVWHYDFEGPLEAALKNLNSAKL